MAFTIQLAYDSNLSADSIKESAEGFDLISEKVEETSTGHSIFSFVGSYEDIVSFLSFEYCDGDVDELEFLAQFIKKI